ncbi:MAG TPA: tripartite tricarboxylate transporter substrate binding protein [Burkholderiales bacterium]|nr:tripartite tricarboxylate transporter substrate binding protein [Burkholderiales bacterium]
MGHQYRQCWIMAALTLFTLIAIPAWPQGGYPTKSVRWIVPWPPGGGADTLTRILSPKLAEALGQQIIVDNRGGAAGNIGAEMTAKSAPDGYTIAFAYSGTHSINPHIYSKLPFKESDFAPIIWLSSVPQVLVVHPSLPVRSVKDLIALDKSRPGQLSFGSSGSGAINHLTGELFNSLTGTRLVHVPYKGGGPAAIALLSGEIGLIFGEPASIAQHVKAGKLRAVAVTSGKRSLFLPQLPTVAESGVQGYEVTSWNGVLTPAGVPQAIIKRLNADFNQIISAPDMTKRMIEFGFEPVGGPPEKFGEFIRAETAKWAPVVKRAGIRVD